MTGNVACTVYVAPAHYDNNIIWEYTIFIIVMQLAVILVILKSNLDERVSDRVLYDILIQAGRIVDLYIPRDKETNRPKGYAFAEYETEEIADYAVRLFSGLVSLYKRPLKFAVSGQEKAPSNLPTATMSRSNSSFKVGPPPVPFNNVEVTSHSARLSAPCSFPENQVDNGQVLPHQSSGYRSHLEGYNYDYSRRVFGATMDSISRTRLSRFDTSAPISYPFY